jgi:tetratricopeptide (TPR) repeat protein
MRQVPSDVRQAAPGGGNWSRRLRPGWIVLLLAASLLAASCGEEDSGPGGGGGGPTTPDYTADELNTMGWASYAVGDYYDAKSYFGQALAKDAGQDEARLGLGWSQAFTGEHLAAITTFNGLLDDDRRTTDAQAGLAAAALFTDPQQSLVAAQAAVDADPQYVFERRESFNFLDLHLIQAQAHFALHDYAAAQAKVEEIEAMVEELPPSGLDPQDPETWVVGGVTYASYQAALAAVIHDLGVMLASHIPGQDD